MIHPLTLVTFAAFLGSGLYVFQTKEEVAKLDRELRDVSRQIEGERSRTQTLSAEWARLNDQDRLRSMVTSHLRDMQPMEPSQFQRLDDAQRRMPQAVAFVPEATGFRRRADAPSAPGEVLVFTAASMLAEAEPRRARPAQRVVPATEPAVAAASAPVVAAPVVTAPVVAAPAPQPAPVAVAVAAASPAARAPAAARPEAAALPPIAGPSLAAATRPVPAVAPSSTELAVAAPRASALPPIAGPAAAPAARTESPAARVADAAPTPRATPRIRVEAPAPRRAQLAQAPIAAPPAPLRTAMHVQPAQASGGSLLGGGMSLPPPVPFGR
ncbi:hypothetical protein EJV46_15360 [Roseococcus sp. SYP-B2431]|uniref:cell division protein FtsL n=1 Tax=Roseococcus sp. SYP-B2431 TaxID=2496640 RepID=UPI00103E6B85|nr:hypothetical protein [Roseococcus sp. SYP-B2431]TCH97502.1 hypothetical protein EJV46_15360 [Roseococcus sp. SYP-B2431]